MYYTVPECASVSIPVLVCVCACEVCVALLALLFGHNVFFFSASQGFLLLFFFFFLLFCFSAAGGWCHEQTRGILANKLDLPQYTPLRTHTHTHALNAPYGRNRDLQEEE